MESFVYYAPTEVIFGRGAEEKTGKAVKKWGGTRVLLVYGGESAKKNGLLGKIQKELEEENIVWEGLGGVKPNPRLSLAESPDCWNLRSLRFPKGGDGSVVPPGFPDLPFPVCF